MGAKFSQSTKFSWRDTLKITFWKEAALLIRNKISTMDRLNPRRTMRPPEGTRRRRAAAILEQAQPQRARLEEAMEYQDPPIRMRRRRPLNLVNGVPIPPPTEMEQVLILQQLCQAYQEGSMIHPPTLSWRELIAQHITRHHRFWFRSDTEANGPRESSNERGNENDNGMRRSGIGL